MGITLLLLSCGTRKKGEHLCDALVKFKLSNWVYKPDKALYNLHMKAKFKAKILNLYKIYK